jgi:hypothetical protein
MSSLHLKAFGGLAILFLVMASLLFATAGTFDYRQAWAFLAVYFAASIAITLYLVKEDRALLTRRMRGGPFAEKEPAQRIIMCIASLGFIGLIVVPGFDHRFGWSQMPADVVIAGDVLGCAWLARHLLCLQGKQLFLRNHRVGRGPEGHIDRPLRFGTTPDVWNLARDVVGDTDCARLVVGRADPCRDHARADMATVG